MKPIKIFVSGSVNTQDLGFSYLSSMNALPYLSSDPIPFSPAPPQPFSPLFSLSPTLPSLLPQSPPPGYSGGAGGLPLLPQSPPNPNLAFLPQSPQMPPVHYFSGIVTLKGIVMYI